MDLFAPKHILIILVVVLLVFGTKKIRNLGPDLGAAFRGFKKAMNGDEDEEQKQIAASAANASAAKKDAEFPDVAAKPSGPSDGKPAPHV